MKKLLLPFIIFLSLALPALAQPRKNLYPTATKSLVILQLRDFSKQPIPKAAVRIAAVEGPVAYEGKTDKNGVWECLLPINQTYWISVGDSVNYNQLSVPNKPSAVTKHTVYFNGWINGKPTAVGTPQFNMMPPSDGQAAIAMEFIGLQDQPLALEKITLTADGTKKTFIDSTDASGRLTMKVPIGENYTMSLAYNSRFDHFEFPSHGGSYNVRVRYKYAGKAAIEDARARRIADQLAYDAYVQRSREEQLKTRDEKGHKKEFGAVPIQNGAQALKMSTTNYGYALTAEEEAPMMSPCYVGGLLICGAGWGARELVAVDAETGVQEWSVQLQESGISNIEGNDDLVVCATESCTIYVIAAKTGKLLWSKWLAGYVLSAPCIADGRLYMCYEDRQGSELLPDISGGRQFSMACFDLRSGEVIWQ